MKAPVRFKVKTNISKFVDATKDSVCVCVSGSQASVLRAGEPSVGSTIALPLQRGRKVGLGERDQMPGTFRGKSSYGLVAI